MFKFIPRVCLKSSNAVDRFGGVLNYPIAELFSSESSFTSVADPLFRVNHSVLLHAQIVVRLRPFDFAIDSFQAISIMSAKLYL